MEVIRMAKRTASNIGGMNPEKGPDIGSRSGYNEETANEPLTEVQKLNNKKRKKNQ